jgi:phosphoglycerate dehydrogenase-like enzyme
LVQALESQCIAGAALDVFEEEPLPAGHVLRQLPNVTLSSRLAPITEGHESAWFEDAAHGIASWLVGSPIRVLNA